MRKGNRNRQWWINWAVNFPRICRTFCSTRKALPDWCGRSASISRCNDVRTQHRWVWPAAQSVHFLSLSIDGWVSHQTWGMCWESYVVLEDRFGTCCGELTWAMRSWWGRGVHALCPGAFSLCLQSNDFWTLWHVGSCLKVCMDTMFGVRVHSQYVAKKLCLSLMTLWLMFYEKVCLNIIKFRHDFYWSCVRVVTTQDI